MASNSLPGSATDAWFERTTSIRELREWTRKLFDVMTEISESAKLAEEYHNKIIECHARIDSCLGQVRELSAKMSTCNNQLAAAAKRSVSVITRWSAETGNGPNCSIGAAIMEIEQIRHHQVELSRRCDRLQSFFHTYAERGDHADDTMGQLLQQNGNVIRANDVEACPDGDAVMSQASQSRRESGHNSLDTVDQHRQIAEPASDWHSELTVASKGRKRRSLIGPSSDDITDSIPQASSNITAPDLATIQPVSSDTVASAGAEFKIPQVRPRGRQRNPQGAAIRATSADNSLPSQSSSSHETNTGELRGGRRSKSAMRNCVASKNTLPTHQNNLDGAVSSDSDLVEAALFSDLSQAAGRSRSKSAKRHIKSANSDAVSTFSASGNDNVDDVVPLNSADDLVQFATDLSASKAASGEESLVVKRRAKRQSKSAAPSSDVTPAVGSDNGGNVFDSADNLITRSPASQAACGKESEIVKPRGHKRSKSAALKDDVVNGTSAVVTDNTASLNCADALIQPAPRLSPSQAAAGNKSEVVKTHSRKRTKSVAPKSDIVNANSGQAVLRQVRRSQKLAAAGDAKQPRSRSVGSSSRRPVTTWLSGRRTDIFRQKSPRSSLPSSRSAMKYIDEEISFGPSLFANTSPPLLVTRGKNMGKMTPDQDIPSPQPKRRRRNLTSAPAPAATASSADIIMQVAADDKIPERHRRRRRALTTNMNDADSVDRPAATNSVAVNGSEPTLVPVTFQSPAKVTDAAVEKFTTTKHRRRRDLTAEASTDEDLAVGCRTVSAAETPVFPDTDDELPLISMVNTSFSVGDVIWVKFRQYPFWPALVQRCTTVRKKRRVRYRFIWYNEDGTLKTDKFFVDTFNPQKMFAICKDYLKLKAEGLASNLANDFQRAIAKVDDSLSLTDERDEAKKLQVMLEFFGFTMPGCESEVNMEQLTPSATATVVNGGIAVNGGGAVTSSDDEEEDEDAAAADVTLDRTPTPTYPDHVKQAIAERTEHAQLLVQCIESDAIKNHLFEVERGHVESRYVTEFHTKSSTRPGQRELRSRGFGPFVDKEDLWFQMLHTLERYMDEFRDSLQQAPEIPSYRSNRALQHIDQLPYIMHAWVPEAVVTALQTIDHCSRQEAENTFARGVNYTLEELDARWQPVVGSSINSPTSADSGRISDSVV